MANSNLTLDRLVDRCGQLYSLPAVAMRVLELTESPAVDVRAIKECIENDPALTCKVLRVVNSSLFGLSREVTELNQAIALLGINPLKLLVLGFSLPNELFVGINGDMLRRYWHHTLIKAVAAREISQTILGMPGDEAFIAGLLQDLGALVLLQELGENFAKFFDAALARSTDIGETERATLEFDHATLSARLLVRWKLPRALVTAVEAGQSRQRIAALPPVERPTAQVLLLAELIASLLAENRTDLLSELLDRGREYLGLTHSQLSSLVAELAGKVDHLAEVLQLELPGGYDYQAILVEAHERLSALATDACERLLSQRGEGSLEPDQQLLRDLERLAGEAAKVAEPSSRRNAAAQEANARAAALSLNKVAGELQQPSKDCTTAPSGVPPLRRVSGDRMARSTPPLGSKLPAVCSLDSTEHDPGFIGRLAASVATCRQARRPLSLLLVEIDQYENLLLACGPEGTKGLVDAIEQKCRRIDHPGTAVVQTRDLQFAVVLPDCDRRQALDISNDLLARIRRLDSAAVPGNASGMVVLSVGVASIALPPRNFPATELIRGAQRCLSGAQLSGGNAVKSIEIY